MEASQESQISTGSSAQGGEPAGQSKGQVKPNESSGQPQSQSTETLKPQAAEPPKAQVTSGTAQKVEPATQLASGTTSSDSVTPQDSKPATVADNQRTLVPEGVKAQPETSIERKPDFSVLATFKEHLGLEKIHIDILQEQRFDLSQISWEQLILNQDLAKNLLTAIKNLPGLNQEKIKKIEEQLGILGENPMAFINQREQYLNQIINNPDLPENQRQEARKQLEFLQQLKEMAKQNEQSKKTFFTQVIEQAPYYIKLFGIGGLILLLMGLMRGFEEFKRTPHGR